MTKKTLAFVVYPGVSLLELVACRTLLGDILAQGPLLRRQAGYDVVVVGERRGEITTDTPLAIIPQKTFAEVPQPDALVVIGGGADTLPALENAELLAYVRHAGEQAQWVAATSTGSLLLAAAGLLEGRSATTHWAYADRLETYGVHSQVAASGNWVTDGKYTTAAGVSGAVDMALGLGAQLTNRATAQFAQLMIEYDPHPPFGKLDWSTFDERQAPLASLMSQNVAVQDSAQDSVYEIAFILYPGLTVFDLAGPLQVLSTLSRIAPRFRPVVVAEQADPVMTDIGVRMVPNTTFADLPHPAVFFVPGGLTPTLRAMSNPAIRQYIRTAAEHTQWIVSVCTGALLLAAVGLLEGREVTTHWSTPRYLKDLGARYVQKRWTVNGNIINAAGVSAGIDTALYTVSRLTDEETARTVQWLMQYDPQPPFGGIDYQRLKLLPRFMRESLALIAPFYTTRARRLTRQERKATAALH
ncbi:MAG: DJ-1/PfpI family protein [Ktedonobacteraceae bacterium]|nr:DJ-1/PfpI family protein [Ktedonobacteraceae bacterium]